MEEWFMIENNPDDVFAAFEILLEEIEVEIDLINKVASRAIEGRDYKDAREAIERADQTTALRDKVVTLPRNGKR